MMVYQLFFERDIDLYHMIKSYTVKTMQGSF